MISSTIRTVFVLNLFVFGLAACSSTPAPWSRPDTSPWSEKRAAEASAVPPDELVVQEPVIATEPLPEPTLLAEPAAPAEPVVVPEPSVIDVPPPEAVEAHSVVSEINNEQRIMSLPGSSFAVQAYASTSLDSMNSYVDSHQLGDMLIVKTDRDGKTMYVLVEIHDTRDSANEGASVLEQKIGSKPWIRSVAGLQKIVQQ